jgi:hypothetical protein
MVGPPYKTDALGNVKDAKEIWLLGKTPVRASGKASRQVSVRSATKAVPGLGMPMGACDIRLWRKIHGTEHRCYLGRVA